ncbi:hypothetical protein BBP40_003106 [Aspergillus hancockii]|nr:hypothetical protein BBP40_003106 [Aspergillus hancockii]
MFPVDNKSKFFPLGHTSQEIQSDRGKMNSVDVDIDDLPHPDTLFFWAQKNGKGRHELSVSPRCLDGRICHFVTNSATSGVSEARLSSSETLVSDNDDAGHMNLTLDEGEGHTPGVARLKCPFPHQAAEQRFSRPGIHHCTESSCPNPTSRKRSASAALETETDTPCGPRTRARAGAEAFHSFSTSHKGQPYSTVEDKRLRKLVERGLPWDQIWMIFGEHFAGRTLKSLQVRWSRHLRYAARPAKRSQRRRGANVRVG